MDSKKIVCQNCPNEFAIEPPDFDFYKMAAVPPPTWCPECRWKRRMVWRNERSLFWRKCDLCHKTTLSMYREDFPHPVYCHECFLSDNWDPLIYGREIDWTRPFLDQFRDLMNAAPRVALIIFDGAVNCHFANFTKDSKDVYLAFSIVSSENIAYSFAVDRSRDSFDSLLLKDSQSVCQTVQCDHCYKSSYLVNCRDCIDSRYLYDCVNCQNCFMSANLRNKQYVFRGQQLTKEEYEKAIAGIKTGSRSEAKLLAGEFSSLFKKAIHRYADVLKSVNCTGENVANSKDTWDSFGVYDMEHCRFVSRAFGAKDVWDVYSCGASELMYEGMLAGHESYNNRFFIYTHVTRESQFMDWCRDCSNVFGCARLRQKQYCILNKQYTKEEYEALVPKIIEHMDAMPFIDKRGKVYKYGEFFPPEFCPFPYNESVVQEFFPSSKEQAEAEGYLWREPEKKEQAITKKSEQLPDSIEEISDSVVNEIIGCDHDGKCSHQCAGAFRIIPSELAFYRQAKLALPTLCPNCRYYERLKFRNPMRLWDRVCQCPGSNSSHPHGNKSCSNKFKTPYSPEREEIIYCEACYQAEIQ